MTVPSYTEDLTDVSLADEATGWVELSGTDQDGEAYNANGSPAYEDNEYPYIQGLYAVTQDTTKSTSVGSLAYSSGGITIPTDGALFLWHNYSSPFAMGTYAQGGYRICMGSGLADFDVWYVGGSDKDNNPYGGWVNHVVNDTVARDNWAGTSTSIDYVGSAISVISGPSKGEPHQCDAIRYGRGSAIFEFGETDDYCTLAGFAALNDAQAARWGLIQATSGGYLWKGRFQLGSATNPVDFRDANKTVFGQWTPKVTVNFNTIEIINASSNIEMIGFQFIVLDPSGTASKGRWLTTDNATVVLTSCTFNDMYTFLFGTNTTITSSNFLRCDQITHAGSTMDSCIFTGYEGTVDSAYLIYNIASDIDGEIDDCYFAKGTAATHAIQFGASASNTHTLRGLTFNGYNATDEQTDSTLYFSDTGADVSWTINLVGCTGNISYKKVRAGDTVTFVVDPVTTGITVKDLDTGTLLEDAMVLVWPTDSANYFFEASVTVSGSVKAASVAHTAHGLATNDYVIMSDVTDDAYNGTFQVTVTDVNNYTYTTLDTITSTGISGVSTFAFISGLTNASGFISDTRSLSSAQTILGRVRLPSVDINGETVYLKQGIISGSIDNATGFSTTIQLVRD